MIVIDQKWRIRWGSVKRFATGWRLRFYILTPKDVILLSNSHPSLLHQLAERTKAKQLERVEE